MITVDDQSRFGGGPLQLSCGLQTVFCPQLKIRLRLLVLPNYLWWSVLLVVNYLITVGVKPNLWLHKAKLLVLPSFGSGGLTHRCSFLFEVTCWVNDL